jgi:VanZ family protein
LQFKISQSGDDLFVKRQIIHEGDHSETSYVAVDHVFHQGSQSLIMITSGPQGMAVYVNGALVKRPAQFRMTGRDVSGQLVIGNSPIENLVWTGQLLGLGIYNQEFTAAQALWHYNAWTRGQASKLADNGKTLTLYLFDERQGRLVRNHVPSQPDIYIPEKFFILHQPLLVSPREDFRPTWTYVEWTILNIAAFVPLGLFFCAYFLSLTRISRAVLATVILGATVSFAIELLQAYLPTRDSGTTDIITNTLGTALGAILCRSRLAQVLLRDPVFPTMRAQTVAEMECSETVQT